jgi:hypothetical protein
MKQFLKLVCFVLLYCAGNNLLAQTSAGGPCPDINVSTGIDATGNAIAIGATDPFWTISSGPVGPAAKRVQSYLPYWQVTPVPVTNACWINGSGTIFNNATGNYTFSRTFTIAPGATSFTTNFGIAWDDVLVSIQLIPPGAGPAIPLTVPPSAPYMVSPPIGYTVLSPAAGVWTIECVVHFVDNVGAFILSGSIDVDCNDNPCTCENVHPEFTYTTSTDCITTFTAMINPNCANTSTQIEWIIDGVSAGFGPTFNYAFLTNGPHTVCMVVTITLADGTQCRKESCRTVNIDCNPCSCDLVIPHFTYTVDKCIAQFVADPSLPCCIKDINYEWYVDGLPAGSGQNFSHTFTSNGFYNVCLFITAILNDGTVCYKEICQLVEIKDCDECNCNQLQPSFNFNIVNCEGYFDAVVSAPPCMKDFTYQWYVNGLPSGTGPNLIYTFPANGPYNICLQVTTIMPDGSSCTKEFCKIVKVKDCDPCNCDQLEIGFDHFLENCIGHFTGLVGLPACMEITGWNWSVNGVYVGSGPVFDYTFPANGVYNVCLTVTTIMPNGQKCFKEVCQLVEVKDCDGCNCQQLQPNFEYQINQCDVELLGEAYGPNCMSNYQYEWYVNGSPVGSGQNFVWTAPANGTYTICLFVTVTLPDGTLCHKEICKDIVITDCDQCNCSDIVAGFNWQIVQCTGYFNAYFNQTPCIQSYSVDWYVDGLYVGSGTPFSMPAAGNGSHTVCMVLTTVLTNGQVCQTESCKTIDIVGCGCPCSLLNGIINFQVDHCNIHLVAQPQIPQCMLNSSVPTSYSWTVNGSYAGSGPVINYTAAGNGTYHVCVLIVVTKPNGQKCEKMICKDIVVSNCNATPTNPQTIYQPGPTMEESLKLYPNPASTELNIDFVTKDAGTVNITFKTIDGKVFLNQSIDAQAGPQRLKMPIAPMVSDEMILVEITADGETTVRKVSVVKH